MADTRTLHSPSNQPVQGHNDGSEITTPQLIIINHDLINIKWHDHRHWSLRLMELLYREVKLQTLLAWCNTLGGAHSSLGEQAMEHAAEAGLISHKQLVLSYQRGDLIMITRCRLYSSFSLIQQGHLSKAKNIIKKEYKHLTQSTLGPADPKLLNMCLSAWNKYKEKKLQSLHKKKLTN